MEVKFFSMIEKKITDCSPQRKKVFLTYFFVFVMDQCNVFVQKLAVLPEG